MKKTILFIASSIFLNAISVQIFSHTIAEIEAKEKVAANTNENTTSCVKFNKNGIDIDICYEVEEKFLKKKS